jgi:hypothetical protein
MGTLLRALSNVEGCSLALGNDADLNAQALVDIS